MTIHITPEIETAYQEYVNTAVDWDFLGTPIFRKDTYPFKQSPGSELLSFAAGYQSAKRSNSAHPTTERASS